jgi:lipopolysaccharide transport system ATP-binding protein
MIKNVNLTAHNLGVSFPIYSGAGRSFKQSFISTGTGGRIASNANNTNYIQALEGINFTIKAGEKIGLVGHNGSGKTTLLRVLANIYKPTQGALNTTGTVASLLDIGLGMDAEATGYENIKIRGLLLGLSDIEIDKKMDSIAAFSDLGNFLNMPMRTYSSGMIVRLGFSVSTSIEADIILMDEWLSVGDTSFQVKATSRLNELVYNSSILVIASHDTMLIDRLTNKKIHLKSGKQVTEGCE